jgi:hypothetical protein
MQQPLITRVSTFRYFFFWKLLSLIILPNDVVGCYYPLPEYNTKFMAKLEKGLAKLNKLEICHPNGSV